MTSTAGKHAGETRSGVLERVTQIVDCLVEAPGRVPLEELSAITGIPRSTTARLLSRLVGFGWVDHREGGYAIGSRLVPAYGGTDLEELRSIAGPALNELASATGSVAHLAVMRGGFVHYLDKIGGGAAASVPSRVGTRLIASEAVCGLAILARLPRDEVDAILERSGVERAARSEVLHSELAEIRRRRGVAFRNGATRASGITSIGAAIVGPDGPSAAISVARRGALSVPKVGALVTAAAESISESLFGDWRRQPGASARARANA